MKELDVLRELKISIRENRFHPMPSLPIIQNEKWKRI